MVSENGDFSEAVKLCEDVYFVGNRTTDRLLQINPYLRVYKNKINFLIDPGPSIDYPQISSNVSGIIGDMAKVTMYSLNHQDPDVASNALFLKASNPKAVCLTTEDTWRLVSGYGIVRNRALLVDKLKNWTAKVPTGHRIQFVSTPYCHFVGAVAVYDLETRILFSGDLFGGLNEPGDTSLYATEDSWKGMKTFHQIYMPSRSALRYSINKIRKLNPKPLMIAPQHGAVITEDLIDFFLDKLYHLETGIDLLDLGKDKTNLGEYEKVAQSVYRVALDLIQDEKMINKSLKSNEELISLINMTNTGVITLKKDGKRAVELLVMVLSRSGINMKTANHIKAVVIQESVIRNVSPPTFGMMEGDDEMIKSGRQHFLED